MALLHWTLTHKVLYPPLRRFDDLMKGATATFVFVNLTLSCVFRDPKKRSAKSALQQALGLRLRLRSFVPVRTIEILSKNNIRFAEFS